MEEKVSIPMKANEMPTAKASMLVAMAKVMITFKLLGSKPCWSLSLNPSLIIRKPKIDNNPKAIQWSMDSIK